MKYVVKWSDDSLAGLARLWTWLGNRPDISAAQARIDDLLAADPIGNGEHVSEGLYGLNVLPLRALFEIDAKNLRIKITSIAFLPKVPDK